MKNKAVVAEARELTGFVWAIGREVQSSGWQGIRPSLPAAQRTEQVQYKYRLAKGKRQEVRRSSD